MPLDHHSGARSASRDLTAAPGSFDKDAAVASFEDDMWRLAEQIFAAGAPGIQALSEVAALIRRRRDDFDAVLTAMGRLSRHDAATPDQTADARDMRSTRARMLRRLADDLTALSSVTA